MVRKLFALIVVAVAMAISAAPALAGGSRDLDQAKAATRQFRDLRVAKAAGYGLLVDANGIACIAMPGMGAMGIHYVNSTLVGDAEVNPTTPEALVYERAATGGSSSSRSSTSCSSRPGTPRTRRRRRSSGTRSTSRRARTATVPAGTFAMWNPRVHCGCATQGRVPDGMQMEG
jgi:hypothetical protein